ncbi:MAG: hypothetical protein MUC55_08785 [Burkholderiales bacterium]|nr:hypothetical protein [Burkholderiales bacterium]
MDDDGSPAPPHRPVVGGGEPAGRGRQYSLCGDRLKTWFSTGDEACRFDAAAQHRPAAALHFEFFAPLSDDGFVPQAFEIEIASTRQLLAVPAGRHGGAMNARGAASSPADALSAVLVRLEPPALDAGAVRVADAAIALFLAERAPRGRGSLIAELARQDGEVETGAVRGLRRQRFLGCAPG